MPTLDRRRPLPIADQPNLAEHRARNQHLNHVHVLVLVSNPDLKVANGQKEERFRGLPLSHDPVLWEENLDGDVSIDKRDHISLLVQRPNAIKLIQH